MNRDKDLFGDVSSPSKRGRHKRQLFDDYEGFVEKFVSKKTTDDCYTPQAVYDVVLAYVAERYDLSDKVVMRPFYPGGDYQNEHYPNNAVVIDNPPFSIIAEIRRFYSRVGIPYFLFAPTLTLCSTVNNGETYLTIGASITYENGAIVNTSFVTNMLGDDLIVVDGDFRAALEAACCKVTVKLPKYRYPNNVTSAALLQKINKKGIKLTIKRSEAVVIRKLDYQGGAAIFGCGFLLSSKAAAEKAAAEKAAAEKAAAEKATEFSLSPRELEIIKLLDQVVDDK